MQQKMRRNSGTSREEILKCFLFEFIDVEDVEQVLSTRKIFSTRRKIESLGIWAMEIIIYIEKSASLLVILQDISQRKRRKQKI